MERKKLGFSGVMLIYIIVMITVLFVALAFWWRWLDRLEGSRTESVMEHYMTDTLQQELETGIRTYSIAHQASYQTADSIAADLAVGLGSDRWSYEKNTALSTDEAAVYTLLCNDSPVGEAVLKAEPPVSMDMGFDAWADPDVVFDFSVFGKTITVMAPYGCEVLLSGEPVGDDLVLESIGLYPQLEAYESVITDPNQLLVYEIGDLYADVAVECSAGYTVVKDETPGVYYMLPACEAELAEELIEYCKDFVGAYVEYTANNNSLWLLQQYLVEESALYEEITQSSAGLEWGNGVNAVVENVEIKDFTYYGNVITCQAVYSQTRDDGDRTDNMKILLQKTLTGWRVLHIETE